MGIFKRKAEPIPKPTANAVQVTNFNQQEVEIFAKALLDASAGEYVIMPTEMPLLHVTLESGGACCLRVGAVLSDIEETL